MKQLLSLLCLLCLAQGAAAQTQEAKKVVISSSLGNGISDDVDGLFRDELGNGLTQSGEYKVIPHRAEFATVLKEEAGFQETGLVDDQQMLELGRAAGADYGCFVTIRKIGVTYRITCKFQDLREGSMSNSFSETARGESELIDAAINIARSITRSRDMTQASARKWVEAPGCILYNDKLITGQIGITDEQSLTFKDALAYCQSKGADWRLPTKKELKIIYLMRSEIERNGATKFQGRDYWSSSRRNNYESYVVNFSSGDEQYYSVNIKNVFRCVR